MNPILRGYQPKKSITTKPPITPPTKGTALCRLKLRYRADGRGINKMAVELEKNTNQG